MRKRGTACDPRGAGVEGGWWTMTFWRARWVCAGRCAWAHLAMRMLEAGVVDEDESVGLVFEDVLFTEIEVVEDGAEIGEHFDEAHKGEVFVVSDKVGAGSLHEIATPTAGYRPARPAFQFFYKIAAVQVAGGLPAMM